MVPLAVSKPLPRPDAGHSLPWRGVLLVLRLFFQVSSEGWQMEKETRRAGVDEPEMKWMLEKDRERRRECWRKQPAQDEECLLGLPDNSQEHPSFDAYGRCLFFSFSKGHIAGRGINNIPRARTHFALFCVQRSLIKKAFPIPAAFSASPAMIFWC